MPNVTLLPSRELGQDWTKWGGMIFHVGKPVEIDPESASSAEQKELLEHILKKARTSKFYTVEDVKPEPMPMPVEHAPDPDGHPPSGENPMPMPEQVAPKARPNKPQPLHKRGRRK